MNTRSSTANVKEFKTNMRNKKYGGGLLTRGTSTGSKKEKNVWAKMKAAKKKQDKERRAKGLPEEF